MLVYHRIVALDGEDHLHLLWLQPVELLLLLLVFLLLLLNILFFFRSKKHEFVRDRVSGDSHVGQPELSPAPHPNTSSKSLPWQLLLILAFKLARSPLSLSFSCNTLQINLSLAFKLVGLPSSLATLCKINSMD
ncbi:hypothetical protein C2845_PM16G21820 [Panicum miliaceum]|uniref:Uncharacterized protein n=1 Tax=Panicum miliaceum TaxID=4540 RepID=A0A3L6Q1L4_PANMI|nr:hypothetical protein C2845_PM16G21820 [Panicum miliaceum]